MVLDTSAIASILLGEPDSLVFAEAVADGVDMVLSAASYLELALVLRSRERPQGSADAWVDTFLNDAAIRIEPVTADQARIARTAYARFGKGTGHPAQLNFGDCFAYALAKSLGAPLLYKGGDFSHTDIASALP